MTAARSAMALSGEGEAGADRSAVTASCEMTSVEARRRLREINVLTMVRRT